MEDTRLERLADARQVWSDAYDIFFRGARSACDWALLDVASAAWQSVIAAVDAEGWPEYDVSSDIGCVDAAVAAEKLLDRF